MLLILYSYISDKVEILLQKKKKSINFFFKNILQIRYFTKHLVL